MNDNGSMPPRARFDAALKFATRVHTGQYRKGTHVPYIAHPLAVAGLAMHFGADEDTAMAALLHDTVEDGGGRPVLWRLRWAFGRRVAAIVEGCTDAFAAPKPPWEDRKRAYVAKLAAQPQEIKLVVACDKLDNLRATADDLRRHGRRSLEKFSAAPSRLRWYYAECCRAVSGGIPSALAARLEGEFAIVEPWLRD